MADDSREEQATAVGAQIAAGYRRVPQAQPDEWGSLSTAADVATQELAQRLDAEERQAGHAPW